MKEIVWFKQVWKEFEFFFVVVWEDMQIVLDIVVMGGKVDIVKFMKGLGLGVMEIVLLYWLDVYRVIYVVQFENEIWVVYVFQKKLNKGIVMF